MPWLPAGPVLPPGPPETLLRWLRNRLGLFGITRLADVTGLDHLGIPVAVAVRPNARSLSVSQGKGLDRVRAFIGAAMESIETWHAEVPPLPEVRIAPRRVAGDRRFLDLSRLTLHRGSRLRPELAIPWLPGRDLASGRELAVPAELVELDSTRRHEEGRGCFPLSSSGLASSRTPAEAVLHALLELVERDALTLFRFRDPEEKSARRVDLERVGDPVTRALIERLRAAGMLLGAWDATTDLGIPTFFCHLMPERPRGHDGAGWELGSAARPCPSAALRAAIFEAVQARLTQIVGVRDDIGRERYAALSAARLERHRMLLRRTGGRDLPAPCWSPSLPAATQLDLLLDRLSRAGLDQVAVVDLARPELGVPVVKTIVPGLEDGVDLSGWRPGPRARAAGAGP
ncbi:MAG: YcaO-like family protein [Geminicoccaceae bacterium]|nr:YcaO-like family protein [Geminicoccaceae bacterium]MDW8340772.1 YcaO-like family protein [Geminicoccaceae bacterium]